jgi:oxidoreductase
MRYLVTGATGFIGGHVVDRLIEAGHRVRAHVLEPDAAERLEARAVEVRLGDLILDEDLAPLLEGVDVVVHCAGIAARGARREDIWRVNVEGTRRLVAACASAGLSRFVYLSSVAVYGHALPPAREDAPQDPVNVYGESKCAAEEAIWSCRAETGLPAVVLRPCLVYGERDRRLPHFFTRMSRLRLLPLPSGGNRVVALVHVSDLVDAVVAASTSPRAVGNAYNVTDGERHTYRDVLDTLRETTGRRPWILPVPGAVFATALKLLLWVARLKSTNNGSRADLSKSLRIFDLDCFYSLDAARADLGYDPRVTLAAGLRRTLAWSEQSAR